MHGFIASTISMSIAVSGLITSSNPRQRTTKIAPQIASRIRLDGCQKMLGKAARVGASKSRQVKLNNPRRYCRGKSFNTQISNKIPLAVLATPSATSAPAGPNWGIARHPMPITSNKQIHWLRATKFGLPMTYKLDWWTPVPTTRVRILQTRKIASSGPTALYWLP